MLTCLDKLAPRVCAVVRSIETDDEEMQRLKTLGVCVGRRVELVRAVILSSSGFWLAARPVRRTRRPRPRRNLQPGHCAMREEPLRMSDCRKFLTHRPVASQPNRNTSASRLHTRACRQSERGQDHALQRADRVARQDRQFPRHYRRAPSRQDRNRQSQTARPSGFARALQLGKFLAGRKAGKRRVARPVGHKPPECGAGGRGRDESRTESFSRQPGSGAGLPRHRGVEHDGHGRRDGIRIDVAKLRTEFGCVLCPISARNGKGIGVQNRNRKLVGGPTTDAAPKPSRAAQLQRLSFPGALRMDGKDFHAGHGPRTCTSFGRTKKLDDNVTHPVVGVMIFNVVMLAFSR